MGDREQAIEALARTLFETRAAQTSAWDEQTRSIVELYRVRADRLLASGLVVLKDDLEQLETEDAHDMFVIVNEDYEGEPVFRLRVPVGEDPK